jgi:DNA topoisomerase VI subunit B
MSQSKILPPDPSRLIEGLRDTGYEFNTALADIVDNSIDAKAKKIRVWIRMDLDGDVTVSVTDNGHGMDEAALLNAMTYGAKSKKDKSCLGKFGLGLKTASTAFCRRLSVVTRAAEHAPVLKATWDLDHVEKKKEWEVLID